MANNFFVLAESFEISINKIKYYSYESQHYIQIDLLYKIVNESNITIFLYDMNKRNDMYYETDLCINNTISKKVFIFKPSNLNGWYGSWGYNPYYPKFFNIAPGAIHEGIVKLQYEIPKDKNPFEMNYEFNFITTNCDIQKYIEDSISNDEINKMINNHIVTFSLQ